LRLRGLTSTALVSVVLSVVMTVSGCGVIKGGSEGTVDKATRREQQFQEMMGRPDIEQVAQRYNEMTATLRLRLEAEAVIGKWHEDPGSGGGAGCRDFPDVEGNDKETRSLPLWVSEGEVADDKWARAVEITQDVAAQYGFETPIRVVVDAPGDHEISTADPFGADLIVGTKLSSVLQVRTGCHLTAKAHQRGTPTIPEFG
jgi:hypothetical protein